jgi:protein-disulfide isomerase
VTRVTIGFLTFLLLAANCFGQNNVETLTQAAYSRLSGSASLEFADFQCPFCAQQARDLRRLQAEYLDTLTVTFKNFPLAFHKQSKAAHLAALAAREQGKFWEMHDLIFGHPEHLSSTDFDRYALELGLDMNKFHNFQTDLAQSAVIDKDITDGKALGVNATPTFIASGQKLIGRQSYERLKQIIAAELKGEPWGTQRRSTWTFPMLLPRVRNPLR